MAEFKYALGEIVNIDPLKNGIGRARGRVVARTEYIDGALAYLVITHSMICDGTARHTLAEYEISPVAIDED